MALGENQKMVNKERKLERTINYSIPMISRTFRRELENFDGNLSAIAEVYMSNNTKFEKRLLILPGIGNLKSSQSAMQNYTQQAKQLLTGFIQPNVTQDLCNEYRFSRKQPPNMVRTLLRQLSKKDPFIRRRILGFHKILLSIDSLSLQTQRKGKIVEAVVKFYETFKDEYINPGSLPDLESQMQKLADYRAEGAARLFLLDELQMLRLSELDARSSGYDGAGKYFGTSNSAVFSGYNGAEAFLVFPSMDLIQRVDIYRLLRSLASVNLKARVSAIKEIQQVVTRRASISEYVQLLKILENYISRNE